MNKDLLSQLMKSTKEEEKKPIKAEKKISSKKMKAGFNLSDTILNSLDDTWHDLKKISGRRDITKSEIIEVVLKHAFKDFDERGEESFLFRMVERKL